jgi:hypothetical protein
MEAQMAKRNPPWTASEDQIVLANKAKVAVTLLVGRTWRAVAQRRFNLTHPYMTNGMRGVPFTKEEDARLRKHYRTIHKTRDLLPLFPGRDLRQLTTRASHLKLKRPFFGNNDVRTTGHVELVDQIQIRCRADGIPIYKLDEILGTRGYFGKGFYARKVVKMQAILKALDFFGGKLVIDWNDR